MWDIILGVLSGFVIYRFGYTMGKRQRPAPAEKDSSICSCGHVYSVHKNDGKCNAGIKTKKYNAIGTDMGYHYTDCACVRYDGIPPAHIFLKDN